jgi:hypothetical protein
MTYLVRATLPGAKYAWLARSVLVSSPDKATAYSSPSAARRARDGFAARNAARELALEVIQVAGASRREER